MDRSILRLAIPNILSNISVPLLSTVDTALMGRLSAVHIAAIGAGSMIFNFIYWNFGFLRMGTTGLTAQSYGAKDHKKQVDHLAQSLVVALVLSLLLIAFKTPLLNVSSSLLNLGSEETSMVAQYFLIRIWDAPATMMLFALMGWMFGMQNSIYPMTITILINLINIVVSYILVVQYNLDIIGVAIGTVVAQYIGVIGAFTIISNKFSIHAKNLISIRSIDWGEIKQFGKVNVDIFIRTLCLTASFGIFYSYSSSAGTIVLATNVILLLFVNWMSYVIDGFAYAAESLVGKYKGAQADNKLNLVVKRIFIWSTTMAVIISIIYFLFPRVITEIFTNQQEIVEEVLKYKYWLIAFPVVAFACYIWDGIFIGLTAVKSMRNAMLAAFSLFVISILILGPRFGNNGLWAALLGLMIFRGVIQTILWLRNGSALS